MKVTISKRARRHLEQIARWSDENRLVAPSMVLDELAQAEQRLRAHPELGTVYTVRTGGGGPVRRILLTRTKYHLYYRYTADHDELVVLAIWGASRGQGPKL